MRNIFIAAGIAEFSSLSGPCVGDDGPRNESPMTTPPIIAPEGSHPYARMPAPPEAILQLTPGAAKTELMVGLAAGDQPHVEQLLQTLVAKYPRDQGLRFFQAVCTRSRFEVGTARWMFGAVANLDATTPEGRCATLMMKIDRGDKTQQSLAALFEVVNANHEDLLIQWAAAIACRTLDHDKEGCQIYKYILAVFAPAAGPSLMHQTYANMLDNLGEFQESLIHRQIVVRMEPAGWSYQGLANTLDALKKYDKADAAYAKALQLAPNNALFWQTWGNSLRHAGRQEEAQAKFAQALTLNPRDGIAWDEWGRSLEVEQNLDQALAKYRNAIRASPGEKCGYEDAARVLKLLGRTDEADEMVQQGKLGSTARDQ